MLRVSADHVSPRFACNDLPVRIGEDYHSNENGEPRVTYYAIIRGYGCSKNYHTPKDAIYAMLADHACTNVRITGEYDPKEYVVI